MRGIALGSALALVVPLVALMTPQPAVAVPQVPQAPVPVYYEDFQNAATGSLPVALSGYTGSAAADKSTYSSDQAWGTTYGGCNGWILNSTVGGTTGPAGDAGCSGGGGVSGTGVSHPAWYFLQQMAMALGTVEQANGDLSSSVTPATNNAVSSQTNAGAQDAGIQLATPSDLITATPGHYYVLSAYFAESHCNKDASGTTQKSNWFDANETLSLIINGTPTAVESNLNPCDGTADSPAVPYTGAQSTPIWVSKFESPALLLTDAQTLGLELYNSTAESGGNDVAFDLPQILDVTPTLDKTFGTDVNSVTATTDAGVEIPITFTITNTSEKGEKDGWSFTDTLDPGLTVVAGSGTTTCDSGVVTPSPDGKSVTVTGNLLAGDPAYCTATVDVITDYEGTYTNDSTNITTSVGLNPPQGSTLVVQPPTLALAKTASPTSGLADGDTVTYTLTVSNPSEEPFTNVDVLDGNDAASTAEGASFTGSGALSTITCTMGGSSVTNGAFTLPAGGSATCKATYVVNQTDVDNYAKDTTKPLTNTAVATGIDPEGNQIDSVPATQQVTTLTDASLSLTKSTDAQVMPAVGGTVTYYFLVTNTGDVTVTNLAVAEQTFTGTGLAPVPSCPVSSLPPGANTTCTATYQVTATDAVAKQISNSATATGKDPSGSTVTSNTSGTMVPAPSLSVAKSASQRSVTTAGDTVNYSFLVTNTGLVPLTGVGVTDTKVGPVSCPVTTLAAGASTTCTASYTVTAADITNGQIVNTATAQGTDSAGDPVTSATSTVTTPVSGISIVKTADRTAIVNTTDTITYSFLVSNTGSTTLNGVGVNDPMLSSASTPVVASCPSTILAVGASMTCTATYTPTATDIAAGSVANTATASGTDPYGTSVTSTPSTVTVWVSTINLVKTASPATVSKVGDVITYTFKVTNNGQVALTNGVITDPMLTAAGVPIVCALPGLTPGQSTTCTAEYPVTAADLTNGSVVNTATATGTDPDGDLVTSPQTSVTTPVSGILVVKTSNRTAVVSSTDVIQYSFQVTNTGDTVLTGVMVNDPMLSSATVPVVVSCPSTTLNAGASMTCTAAYSPTAADIAAGSVVNTATATGTDTSGKQVVSVPSTVTVWVSTINLVKTASPATVSKVGDVITYSFEVENNGNVPLTNGVVTDPMLTAAGVTISCVLPGLTPGQSTTCTAQYTVTAADLTNGSVVNTATATGTDPDGDLVTSPQTSVTTPVSGISIVKTADRTAYVSTSDVIGYSFLVTNTGTT
ncbi:MAG: DUF11 domain-containing protein, partial [Propionibacteriaceae bacterium]|nr:DUF11 domain-containing protein [Propionibacteriaceae bacterium]